MAVFGLLVIGGVLMLPIMRKRIFLDKRRGKSSCFDQFSQA